MHIEHVEVAGVAVELWRKPIKNTILVVNGPEGNVRMSVPYFLADATVREIILSHLPWLKKQQARFHEQPSTISLEAVSGEMHVVWGRAFPLTVLEGYSRHSVRFNPATGITLYVRSGTTSRARLRLLNEWYRGELKSRIPRLLEVWEPQVGRRVAEWRIKRMKTRWGTCNIASRRLWINLELAKKDASCLEYILVHELVHLLERYHNDKFYSHMDRLLPQWRSIDALLKKED